MERFEQIIQETEAFVLSTVDKNGFPLNIILTHMLDRSGSVTLLFYLDEQIKIMKNIKVNPRGTVSCAINHPTYVETLNLNGTFTVESTWKVNGVNDTLNSANKEIREKEAVVVVFEVMNHEIQIVNRLI